MSPVFMVTVWLIGIVLLAVLLGAVVRRYDVPDVEVALPAIGFAVLFWPITLPFGIGGGVLYGCYRVGMRLGAPKKAVPKPARRPVYDLRPGDKVDLELRLPDLGTYRKPVTIKCVDLEVG